MNNIDILGFLGPLVPLLFAGTFFVFWLGQRNAPHILVTGVSFALFSASLFLSQYYFELLDFKMLTTSLVLTSFAVILFTHAMSLRLEIETPKTLMISITLIGVLLGGFASLNIPDIGLRAFILCATLGALFLVSGLNVLKAKEQSRVNCTISIILVVTCVVSLGLASAFWNLGEFNSVESYVNSPLWKAVNFASALMSIILSMALVAAFTSDLVARIKMLSDVDVLTGVKTRRAFELEAQAVFAQHARSNLPISLIVTDLDHFKKINDKRGHLVGDRVLATFGETMSKALRTTDIIGRVGGEEFCIILWNTSEDGAVFVAEGLRSRLEAAEIKGIPAGTDVTASFGVIEVSERESFESAFERADKSMYFAKQTGRNRVCVGNKVQQTPTMSGNYNDQYWSDTVRETSLN